MPEHVLGYHASHEQFDPGRLLELVRLAESEGFGSILASDHFHPWSERQGESGHVWSWLGAAMANTSLDFKSVTAPGYRYHPAIVAQAVGTLRSMYDDRFELCVGSGQRLNEGITGERWPAKSERNERLRECVDILKRLWQGERVTHRGHVTVEEAKLFTRPEERPPVIGAALSVATAEWLAEWADGMITLATPDHAGDRDRVHAFADRAPDKPIYLKAQIAYDETMDTAIAEAHHQWRTNCIPGVVTQELRTPTAYDALGDVIDEEDVREHVRVSDDPDRHVEWLEDDFELPIEAVYLHNVTRNQDTFLEDFGKDVLPVFH